MTGIEIAAAVASIIGGTITASKYASKIRDKLRAGKSQETEQAERLSVFLGENALELDGVWRRMERLYTRRQISGNSSSSSLLSQALVSVQSLDDSLQSLAARSYLPSRYDLVRQQDLADRSRQLTAQLIFQLGAQSANFGALSSPSFWRADQALLELGSNPAYEYPVTVSRSQLNTQDICHNALRLRRNDAASGDLAVQTIYGNSVSWTCRSCGANMTGAQSKLPGATSDMLWIDEAGLFKSHCTQRVPGTVEWTCIWPIQSNSCIDIRFKDERALLQHMKDHHTFVSRRAVDFRLQWPADLSATTAQTCGFGATVEGQVLRDESFTFFLD